LTMSVPDVPEMCRVQ